jgi:hypothetical protein
LIGSGSLKDLISREVSHLELVVSSVPVEELQRMVPSGTPLTQSGSTIRIELETETPLTSIVGRIEASGGKVIALNPIRQSMEDYFFELVTNSGKTPTAS